MRHFPVLIVSFPLIMAFIVFMVGIFWKKSAYFLTLITVGICAYFGIEILRGVITSGSPSRYFIGGWEPPFGIEYVIDHLNAPILASVSVIFFILTLLTKDMVERETSSDKRSLFYSLLLLHLSGLNGVCATGDLFNLYVLLEILSFSAYGIVAYGKRGSEFFAFRYMLFGTLGACAYLLGVGYIYILTGSLNIIDLTDIIPKLESSRALFSAKAFLVLGLLIKMAFFPLHAWLPDAYSRAPSSVTVFLSSLSTKVMAYALLRLVFSILGPQNRGVMLVFDLLGYLAALGIIFSGIMALAQREVVRSLCYILISEVAYIILSVSSWNSYGFKGAILHTINDMFMMASIFSVWATVESKTEKSSFEEWRGLSRKYPYTMAALVLSSLSIIGVPPFCGFFSKWYILLGLIESKRWIFSIIFITSGLLHVIYFFKLIERAYFGDHKIESTTNRSERSEGIMTMENICQYILVLFLVSLGLFSGYIVESLVEKSVPVVYH